MIDRKHKRQKRPDPPLDGGFLTQKELAARWRCTTRTIRNFDERIDLQPFHISERHVLYPVARIREIESRKDKR